MANRKFVEPTSEICLYGTSARGVGWLALGSAFKGFLGTGEPKGGVGFTEAVWDACMALREAGSAGTAWVYEPSGMRRAVINIASPCYFGDLKWEDVPVMTVEAAGLVAASR